MATSSDPMDTVDLRYTGYLADDDFMWIVDCTADDLLAFLFQPTTWVGRLSNIDKWKSDSKINGIASKLLSNFTLSISPMDSSAASQGSRSDPMTSSPSTTSSWPVTAAFSPAVTWWAARGP